MYKTKLLSAVLTILKDSDCPLSIVELQTQLREKKMQPNKTSLYRLLEKLKQNEEVRTLQIAEGVTHYELQNEPHGHFICQKCTNIECINTPISNNWLEEMKQKIPSKSIFKVSLTMKGICTNCLA